MILRYLFSDLSLEAIIHIVILTIIALLVAITIHEFSHAFLATRFNDPTPGRAGRLSLNPMAHLDPMGALMMLLAGFGWAKPVPVNPMYFGRNMLQKSALVAAAGPLSNFTIAAVCAIPFRFGLLVWPSDTRAFMNGGLETLAFLLLLMITYNLILGVFNLIPLAPLDGSKVLPAFLPRPAAEAFYRLEPWGPGILMIIIVLGLFTSFNILGTFIGPVVNVLSGLLVGERIF
ncbi:MAG: site-2 protease family protein [Dehalococcoidia bacterium]|nr:site-2 protease family protein [Dehalococcoidia bacterium]